MEETNYFRRKQSPTKRLNTKGCCFLCLHIINFKTDNEITKPIVNSAVSLKCVSRYLNINTKNIILPRPTTDPLCTHQEAPSKTEKEITADLCASCEEIVKRFSDCFLSLEIIRMEANYWLRRIHQQISDASKKLEQVQNHSKMTRDPEALAQLIFVDNLRKQIEKKSSQQFMLPKVELFRLSNVEKYLIKPLKEDQSEEEINDSLSPLSPTGISEEACETERAVLTTDVENGRKSDSLLQPEVVPQTPNNAVSIKTLLKLKMHIKNKKPNTTIADSSECKEQLATHQANVFSKKDNFKMRSRSTQKKKIRTEERKSTNKTSEKSGNKRPKSKAGTKWGLNSETGKYACVKCKLEFGSPGGAWSHYDIVHLDKTYKCNLCKKAFKTVFSFSHHKKICNMLPRPRQSYLSRPRYKCNLCNASLSSGRSNLSRHKNICLLLVSKRLDKQRAREANPRYTFLCNICGKKFPAKSNLMVHYKSVHLNERNYECDLCDKTFKQKFDLNEHKEFVHFGRKFFCKFCTNEIKVSQKRNFKAHERKCGRRSSINISRGTEESKDDPLEPDSMQDIDGQIVEEVFVDVTDDLLPVSLSPLLPSQTVLTTTHVEDDIESASPNNATSLSLSIGGQPNLSNELKTIREESAKTKSVEEIIRPSRFEESNDQHQPFSLTSAPITPPAHESVRIGKKFDCDICGNGYSSAKYLMIHKSKCEGPSGKGIAEYKTKCFRNAKTGKYTCVKCKREFTHRNRAYVHYQNDHLHAKYECEICKNYFNFATITVHKKYCKESIEKRLAEQRAREIDPNYKFQCNACGKKFKKESLLSSHYKCVHLKERNFGCILCEKKFRTKYMLIGHKNVAHTEKRT